MRTSAKMWIAAISLAFVFSGLAKGQTSSTSPYSRFGIGNIKPENNTRTFGMGGIGYGVRGIFNVNPINPASYTAYDTLSFVADIAMLGDFTTLKETGISSKASHAGLSHFYFGFPVTSWWRTTVGMTPISEVGYYVKDKVEDTPMGTYLTVYSGEGGLNQFFWGNGFKIGKSFSVGFNLNYISGKLMRQTISGFPDSSYIFNTRATTTTFVHDFNVQLGLQYYYQRNQTDLLTFGLAGSLGREMSASQDKLIETLFGGFDGTYESSKSTIYDTADIKGKVKLPMKIGGGFSFERLEKFTIGADIEYSKWSDYRIYGLNDSLTNSLRFALGGEYIPDNRSISSYWQKVRFRAGFRYKLDNLKLKGDQIKEYAISLGMGLPLRRLATTVNISAEFGSRGTTNNGLIQENFVRFVIGINLAERWFIKPKYD